LRLLIALDVVRGYAAKVEGQPERFALPPGKSPGAVRKQLEAMLENVAGAYERDVEGKVARLTTVLSPAIIVLMALIVVFIVFSVLQPILDMQNFVQ